MDAVPGIDLDWLLDLSAALRRTAAGCRADGHWLSTRAAGLSWSGRSGDAFRTAAAAHVGALELAAWQLDAAARAVELHESTTAPMVAALAAGATLAGTVGSVAGTVTNTVTNAVGEVWH